MNFKKIAAVSAALALASQGAVVYAAGPAGVSSASRLSVAQNAPVAGRAGAKGKRGSDLAGGVGVIVLGAIIGGGIIYGIVDAAGDDDNSASN